MKTKYDAQSVVRRLNQVGYSLEQTDQTPKLTQLMKDSITLIEQMDADVKALADALRQISEIDCGCRPCTGSCRTGVSAEIELEARIDIARAALAKLTEQK